MNKFGKTIIAFVVSSALSLTLYRYSSDSTTKHAQPMIEPNVMNQYQEYNKLRIAEVKEVEKAQIAVENASNNRRMAIMNETKLPEGVANTIMILAKQYDFYEETIVGIMNLESKYNPTATNYNTNGSVDMGLMQINSNTLPWLAQQIGKPNADPYNAQDALNMAVWYLDYLRDGNVCQGSLRCALDMYNGDSTGKYTAVVRERIQQVASRMGVNRGRMN